MNIRDVHRWLVGNLPDVAITDPVTKSIAKVWKFIPPARVKLADLPAVILIPHLLKGADLPDGGSVRQDWEIEFQIFISKIEVDADDGADQAAAFIDAMQSFFSAHVRLGGTVQTIGDVRGGPNGTLMKLSHGGSDYVGLSLILPILIQDVRTRGA